MIYLNALGGLCNRLRTIDSLLTICSEKKMDLTVLWVTDGSLNCSFKGLFEKVEVEGRKIKIIDCPTGFPEKFMKNPTRFGDLIKSSDLMNNYYMRSFKNLIKGRFIDENHSLIKKVLAGMKKEQILLNKDFVILYDSQNKLNNRTTREMDNDFIPLVRPTINKMTKECNYYISSCYRLSELVNPYSHFQPIPNLKTKINTISKKFDNTIGLHIRRSDHSASKEYSTTEKFVRVIENELENNPKVNFFLSTDDYETKSNLVSKFGNSILFNEVESYDRNHPQAVQDAVVDLFCLSKTKKIYGSHHSSFSQTAADIGQIEEITTK